MNKGKIIESIDFFKFFACLGVVFIHCRFGEYPMGELFRALGRISVPFFFMVSGYFCLSNNKIDRNKIVRKIAHIGRLTIGAVVFYAIFHYISFCIIGESTIKEQCSEILSLQKLLIFVVQNSPFQYSHLWFLFALIYCYIFVLIFGNNIKGQWKVYYILFSLLFFFLVSELFPTRNINFLIFGVFKPQCLFLLRALPFFFLGMCLKENEFNVLKLKIGNKILWICVLGGFVFSGLERFATVDSQFYLGTYISVLSLFIICVKNPKSISGKIEWLGRNCSLYIYVVHIAVYYVFNSFIGNESFLSSIYKTLCPLIVFFVTMLISLLFVFVKKKTILYGKLLSNYNET